MRTPGDIWAEEQLGPVCWLLRTGQNAVQKRDRLVKWLSRILQHHVYLKRSLREVSEAGLCGFSFPVFLFFSDYRNTVYALYRTQTFQKIKLPHRAFRRTGAWGASPLNVPDGSSQRSCVGPFSPGRPCRVQCPPARSSPFSLGLGRLSESPHRRGWNLLPEFPLGDPQAMSSVLLSGGQSEAALPKLLHVLCRGDAILRRAYFVETMLFESHEPRDFRSSDEDWTTCWRSRRVSGGRAPRLPSPARWCCETQAPGQSRIGC